MIEIVTRKSLTATAAERWYRWHTHGEGFWRDNRDQVIHDQLLALGPEPEPDEVDYVIGHSHCTDVCCSACERSVGSAVALGDDGVYCCLTCIDDAVEKRDDRTR
jgi:hypothetical protein